MWLPSTETSSMGLHNLRQRNVCSTMYVHSSMLLSHQAVVRQELYQHGRKKRAACSECCCQAKVS